jgi:hypothetical protein
MYHMFSPYISFQNMAPTQLTMDMIKRNRNNIRICRLVTFSTFDFFRGDVTAFCTITHRHTNPKTKIKKKKKKDCSIQTKHLYFT